MIIDWIQSIKNLKSDPAQEDMVFETFTNDLQRIPDSVCNGDQVIIRFIEGFRAEVRFLNEIGFVDPKKFSKDFNIIRQYDLQSEKLMELRDQLADKLKDYPEKIAEFDEYIKQKLEHPLFEINYVLNNKVLKSFSGIPYLHVHMSLMGMLMAFYQDDETSKKIKTGQGFRK